MVRKLSQSLIARELGELLSQRLINGCIRDLQKMESSGLSGEDSDLQNVWDEICVQQQIEESIYWSAYLETINCVIKSRLDDLKLYELDAVWLLSSEGEDWDWEEENERETYPVSKTEVASYLQYELLNKANDWSNARITKYSEWH